MPREDFSDRRMIEWLNTFYGIEVSTLTPLFLGADINAFLFKVQGHDQKSYFVKLKRGRSHDIGVKIVDFLHTKDIQQIVPPVKTSQGQTTQILDEFTLTVYPFIEGLNGFNQSLTDNQWLTLGQALKKVHTINLPPEIQNQIRKETYSSKWRDFVRSIYGYIKIQPSPDEWAEKFVQDMKKYEKEIHYLVERAELLGRQICQKSLKFVLCHSDIHGGNVLIDANGFLYLVDWDAPIMALKERDLMFIGGGVANVWNDPHEEKLFYEGYGKTEIDMPVLAYYRHERIVEDVAEFAQALILTTNGENRPFMYQQFNAMFEPSGVVDIAFKTMAKNE